jgi:hypothetical protein
MNGDDTHTTSPSVRVVTQVAAAKGVDPVELDPLSEYLDLESIDALFENSSGSVRVECSIDELHVAVEVGSDGHVRVSPIPTE